jgi:hypothetical protein
MLHNAESEGQAMDAEYLLIVTAEVDPAVEADWNRWYDELHLPDAVACPGVLRGRRYVTSGSYSESNRGDPTSLNAKSYTTVYELAHPGVIETEQFLAMRGWAQFTPYVRSQTRVVTSL